MNDQPITEFCRALIVYFSAHHDGIHPPLAHAHQPHAQLFREEGPRDFDKTQVSDVVDHAGAVGVEKHDLDIGRNRRRIGFVHGHTMGDLEPSGYTEASLG